MILSLFIYVLMNLLQGLDLSPYFLAVAQFKEKKRASRNNLINWVHANGEDTGLPSKSFDIVSMAYVVCLHFIFLKFCKRFELFLNENCKRALFLENEIFNAKSHYFLFSKINLVFLGFERFKKKKKKLTR